MLIAPLIPNNKQFSASISVKKDRIVEDIDSTIITIMILIKFNNRFLLSNAKKNLYMIYVEVKYFSQELKNKCRHAITAS